MKFIVMIIALAGLHNSALADQNSTDLVSVCKSDCPKAKTSEEAHKCAEKKGRLNKDFRKTACYKANEDYEKSKEQK